MGCPHQKISLTAVTRSCLSLLKLTSSQLEISTHGFPASAENDELEITTRALANRSEEESLKLIEDGPFLRVVPK
jgi:hypothetical protein